ncbi:Ankyrin repeat domain-containing protein 17 [Nymphon striatum]|nr:Ankyrin repeat domain-containing protein 17 [Nymphon striatum]
MQDDMSNSTLKTLKGSATNEESPRLVLSSQNNQADEKGVAQRAASFMSDNSDSEDEDVSEVPFLLVENDVTHTFTPITIALSKFSSDVRYSDPGVIKKFTSSISTALDEAAACLNRMRLENPDSESKALSEACGDGQYDAIKELLSKGVNIHQASEEGESLLCFALKSNLEDRGNKNDSTPLMCAASSGNLDIVKLLLKNGADINAQSLTGNTPLMCACSGGFEDIVRLLLSEGASIEDHNENGHTPLMEAASAGHVPIAKILLEHGAGINTHSSEFKESALTLACYKGHVEMVRFLLQAGADQEHKTDEMHTALMEASMDGHVEVAKLLLNSGAQVNMPADSFESPLTLAACGGHVELAMLLIERGANIEEVNDEGYTPLMEAAREGHEEMVALLVSQGADYNAQTEETQETALTLSCCGGFLEVAEFLVKTGANIEAGASTPLMESAQEGHVDLVKYLIEAGCKVNAETSTGDTALTYACENGHTDCAVTLVEHGASLEHESEGGRTPLMKAARSGHLCTVQFLVAHGADVNKQTTNNDHTPLSLACSGGHSSVVEYLLLQNSDPNHKLKDNSTMLIEASKGGHSNIVKLLLDYPNSLHEAPPPPPPPSSTEIIDFEPNVLDPDIEIPPDGHTLSFPHVVGHALPSIATGQSYLHNIQSGSDVNESDKISMEELTAFQSTLGFDFGIEDDDKDYYPATETLETCINLMKTKDRLSSPEELLFQKQDLEELQGTERECQVRYVNYSLNFVCVKSKPIFSTAGLAGLGEISTAVSYPVSLQAALVTAPSAIGGGNTVGTPTITMTTSMLAPEISGASQFISTESNNDAGVGGLMVASPARTLHDSLTDNTSDSQTDSNHDTALTLACAGGHEELVKLLIDRHANIEHRDKKGFTPLILAATAGHISIVSMLVEGGADIEAQSERTKDTPLSLACSGGRMEIVETLLSRSANKEHRNVSDYTPLSLAASGGYVNIIKLLLASGAEINSRTGSKLGISPLMLAAMNGHTAAVKLLLDNGSDINAQIETNKNTALTLACFQGRHEVVSLLVERKASIEHRAKTGLTPLMEAASGGYTDVGRVLLEKSADVNASPVPSSRDTALTIAADKGHYRFVELLLSRGAIVDVKNKKGNSPLWLACNGGHLDVVQLLVNAKADVDSQDNRKISCLMAAFRKGHVKVVRWMVEKVNQFPADSDCNRYISAIGEEELKSKCKECYEIIQSAKVKQAEEANKNAKDLLNILEEEETRDAVKKAAAARKREKKKMKRKEKQQFENTLVISTICIILNFLRDHSGLDCPVRHVAKCERKSYLANFVSRPLIVVETKSSTISVMDHCKNNKNAQPVVTLSKHGNGPHTVSSSKLDSNLICISASTSSAAPKQTSSKSKSVKNESNAISKLAEKSTSKTKTKENKKQANKENKPTKEKNPVTSTSTTLITTITTVTSVTTASGEKSVTAGKKNKKKEISEKLNNSANIKDIHDAIYTDRSSGFNDSYILGQISTTGIGDLDDFGSYPDSNIRNKILKANPADLMNTYQHDVLPVDTLSDSLTMRNSSSTLVNSLRPSISVGHSPNSSSSPKKGQKKEDGWKEVVRKTKRLPIPPHAVSRVLVRNGKHISAIKEISGANIEIEKKDSGGDRYAVIRGSNEAVRQASNMLNTLFKDQEYVSDSLQAATTSTPAQGKSVVGSIITTAKPTKSKSPGLSIYSTPPFPATSVIKQPSRPGIPITGLSNIGAPFSSVSQSWSTFMSTSQSSAVNLGSRKVLGNDNPPKTNVPRQFFNDVSKSVPNVALTSVNKEVVSYTTAVMAPGRNTRTVTTVNTSVSSSAHDYKTTKPALRPTNQVGSSSSYEKISQYKQVVSQNGQLRMTNVQQVSSNSSSGSSGSPVAQDYDPFNSNYMGAITAFNPQNGSKGKNFASVAASGITSLASTNPTIGSLQQTSVQSPTPTSAVELQCGPIDVAKAPGYRVTGSHMSPGSNSASSGHYSAPNTPPIALIGSSHNTTGQRSHSSPSVSSSPPIRPSSLPEHPAIAEKSHSTSVTILTTDNCVNNVPHASALQVNSSDKHHSNIIGNSSSFISNSVPSVCQAGILSVRNSVPGSNYGPSSIAMINSVGGQPRLPVMPLPNQAYPHQMVNPHLQNFHMAPNAMNMTMASVSSGPFPSNNIVSNLNPNAPDFASRSNNSGIMHTNIQPRLQPPHVDPSNLNHQSAFRPLLQNHSFPQSVSSSGYHPTTRIPFMTQLPMDVVGVPTDPSFIINRQSNMNNISSNNAVYPSHDSIDAASQERMMNLVRKSLRALRLHVDSVCAAKRKMVLEPSRCYLLGMSIRPKYCGAEMMATVQQNNTEMAVVSLASLTIGKISLRTLAKLDRNNRTKILRRPDVCIARKVKIPLISYVTLQSQATDLAVSSDNDDDNNKMVRCGGCDGEQHHMGTNKNSISTNQAENQSLIDDRRSLPRPIGTERAYKKPPGTYGNITEDKKTWLFSADPSSYDWMSKRSFNVNNSQNMMTVNQDDSRIPPVPHVMANGNLPNYHHNNVKMVAAVGADVMSLPVEPSHQMDPMYQNIGPGNQGTISSHYNNMPSGVHSNYLNHIQPNIMNALGNQNLPNTGHSINGPISDSWLLPNSMTNVDSHPSSLPDQKQV